MILAHDSESERILTARQAIRLTRPRGERQLRAYIRSVLGFTIPRRPLVAGHDAPYSYLVHAFFEDRSPRDSIVWANRGGGKTQLGAIATLLDLIFKPGIQIRILGGSFEQSSKMYRYLKRLLETEMFRDQIAGNLTGRYVELVNGSRVEVLHQSERSVRGQRVHKLRCDEVELFDPEVWEAAQLVTRSGWCGDTFVRASIEALSTMHRPFGLMQRIIREAASGKRRVFRWNVLDTLRTCEPERPCAPCPLWAECQGRAKRACGFIEIDDAIQQKHRVGESTWSAEMLCEQPTRADTVYPEFEPKVHLFVDEEEASRGVLAPGISGHEDVPARHSTWIAGIDFGFRSPTVLLFAFVNEHNAVHIMDELFETERTTEEIIARAEERLTARGWPRPEWLGADPAGHQRSEHTGLSTITLWKQAGWAVRTRALPIEAGILAVRRRLKRADGSVGLRIHPRCERLIQSLTMYHYSADHPESLAPVKDGRDHAADALRYMITNLDRPAWSLRQRLY